MPSTRILVVDDDPDFLRAIHDALADEGYEVLAASTGEEALGHLKAQPLPCVVLADLRMPGISGRGLLAAMKADQLLASIPVVVVTASVDPPPSGAFCLLRKPFSLESLLHEIARCCGRAPEKRA